MKDAHNHLQDARFDIMRERIIDKMLESCITRCVVNGTCPEDWSKVANLAVQHPDLIIPSFGLHPWKKATPNWQEQLIEFLEAHTNACLGECGLDKWIKNYDLNQQTDIFTIQLDIATQRNLPLTIHCLKAWGPLVEILENNQLPERGFLLHSYSGSAELIPRLTKLGAYFSFSGYFLHSRKSNVLNTFHHVPTDRLLIETDAPDMLPPNETITHPLENQLNHPVNLIAIANTLGRTIDISMINENFVRFFEAS